MIILRPYELQVLPLVPKEEWMIPSQACEKDTFGNDGYRVFFHVQYKLHDGFVKWHGRFQDREDFDAFLWAIATDTLKYQPALWCLSNPHWYPELDEYKIIKHFITISISSSPGVPDVGGTLPSDWNATRNFIQGTGGGGSGGVARLNSGRGGCGGGGAAYMQLISFVQNPGTSYLRGVAAGGGSPVTFGNGTSANGVAGGNCYLKNSAGTIVWQANGGGGGQASASNALINGGAGGAGGIGTFSTNGGRGGNRVSGANGGCGTGGGGSAGASTGGGNGVDWGGGGGTAGGAAGTGGYGNVGGGGNFNGWGGGGNLWGSGGGGGNHDSVDVGGGAGAQGILELIYTPPIHKPNLPMLGM